MNNYDSIRVICNQSSAFSRPVIDEFLMHYAARQEGLEKEMDRLLAPFRQVTKTFQPGWIGMIKAQYIAHRIFRKDGLIKKYPNPRYKNINVYPVPDKNRKSKFDRIYRHNPH